MGHSGGRKIPCNDIQLDNPENDDCTRASDRSREISSSQVSMADRIYEALSSLSLDACALLSRAADLEMTAEAMQEEPQLASVLRRLRYPSRKSLAKRERSQLKIVSN